MGDVASEGAMATHRTTDWADALLDHSAAFQGIAERLLGRPLSDREQVELGLLVGRRVLGLGGLSEDIRRGNRPRHEEPRRAA